MSAKPFCDCGHKAQLRKVGKVYYYKCSFCNKSSVIKNTIEEARKNWVDRRKKKVRWY